MPKMKTHKGAAKRFKVTGSGKILRERAFMQHNFGTKSPKQKRRLSGEVELAPGDGARIKRLLGR
ncbi:MAG: 50S ribosomal protein L35 [Acidimicrobiia bacterium]|nr:50S ribosomal protein L35 [Acidimicrobiia bacterium]